MPHRNAPLTETGRLRLARCVVDDGWPVRRAAERFQVSPTTASRWASRYRQYGPAGMGDRGCGRDNRVRSAGPQHRAVPWRPAACSGEPRRRA
jgi:transposase